MYSFGQKILLVIIRSYQASLSPDHGWYRAKYPYGWCRFYPSCSQYAYDSIAKHGAGQGVLFTIQRLSKCHPWHRGGYDLVK